MKKIFPCLEGNGIYIYIEGVPLKAITPFYLLN